MHRLFGFGYFSKKYIKPIKKGNFQGCIIIYIICYIISLVMSAIFKDTKLRHLFT